MIHEIFPKHDFHKVNHIINQIFLFYVHVLCIVQINDHITVQWVFFLFELVSCKCVRLCGRWATAEINSLFFYLRLLLLLLNMLKNYQLKGQQVPRKISNDNNNNTVKRYAKNMNKVKQRGGMEVLQFLGLIEYYHNNSIVVFFFIVKS